MTVPAPSSFSLEGKVAVVTGALGLLGRQHCSALAEAGATVVVSDLNHDACQEAARALAARFGRAAFGHGMDVTSPDSVDLFTRDITRVAGHIDVLVNNAALDDKVPASPTNAPRLAATLFETYPLDRWQCSLNVNVTGTFLCCQRIGAGMARRGSGSIINIASIYGLVGPDQSLYRAEDGTQTFYKSAVYSTTKGAVTAFTRFLAAYWGSSGVRVNTLSPGGVEDGQNPFFVRQYAGRTPLGRMAQPDDYKGALVFLASDASSYMTGSNLVVDGGWTAW